MGNTYWSHNGKFQQEYRKLWNRLIPSQGPAKTKAGEVLRAMCKLYYRWYNDGDKIEPAMRQDDLEGSAVNAFRYLYQFRDTASDFSTQDLMENVVNALTEDDYEQALEKAADAVIEWAYQQPDTPNDEDYLDAKFDSAYTFEILNDDEDDEYDGDFFDEGEDFDGEQ